MNITFEKTELQTLLNDVHNWHAKKLRYLIENIDWSMVRDARITGYDVKDRLSKANERFAEQNPEPKWTDYLK